LYYIPTTLQRSLDIDKIYTIHYFEYHRNFTFSGERHLFWELLYIDRGEVTVRVNDEQFIMYKNQMILHAPGDLHAIAANGKVAPNTVVVAFSCNSPDIQWLEGRILHTNEYERQTLASIVREAEIAFENKLGDPSYRKLIPRPQGNLGSNAYGAQQMILSLLEMLLLSLLRKGGLSSRSAMIRTDQKNLQQERIRRVVDWIETNIDRRFNLNEICVKAMLNKSTFGRVFRQQMGMSIIHYCRQAKIERAKQHLREDSMNITQIADLLGFSSIHYFSRTFKQITGMSPTEYAMSVRAIIDHSRLASEGEPIH